MPKDNPNAYNTPGDASSGMKKKKRKRKKTPKQQVQEFLKNDRG